MKAEGAGLTFKGREFGCNELEVIRDVVGNFKRLSRQELANTVCELLDWRRPNGGLKTSEARELLEMLYAAGQIVLPAASSRGRPRGSKTQIPLTTAGQAQPELCAELREVEPVRLCLVETAEQRRQWRELVERYHPEGCSVPVGANRLKSGCQGSKRSWKNWSTRIRAGTPNRRCAGRQKAINIWPVR